VDISSLTSSLRRAITGVKMIAASRRIIVCPSPLHKRQRTAAESGVPAIGGGGVQLSSHRMRARADKFEWAVKNPIVIRNGHMLVCTDPGLGMELNQDFLKANRPTMSLVGLDGLIRL